MVLKYWTKMILWCRSISSKCSVMIFSWNDRVLSLVLVAALLICCAPVLGVPVNAAGGNYLYNGVELPELPESELPYAIVQAASLDGFGVEGVMASVLFMAEMPVLNATESMLEFGSNVPCHEFRFTDNSDIASSLGYPVGSWYDMGVDEYSVFEVTEDMPVIWTSHDILNGDGTIYLAASSPVPVGGSGGSTPSASSITSVSILCPSSVRAGLDITVSVDVFGTGDFDSSATLSLSGGTSSSTKLTKGAYGNNWLLDCGADETASTLTLTAASVQDPSITDTYQVLVNGSLDPTDPADPSDPLEPSSPEETVPGETVVPGSGDLNDKSDQISDGLGDIQDFEQSQKDVLDNNMDFILGTFAFDDLIPALAFVGGYINLAFVSMASIQLLYFVPLVIGLFFFICSRAPGASRWKPRRPPPDPIKKK